MNAASALNRHGGLSVSASAPATHNTCWNVTGRPYAPVGVT